MIMVIDFVFALDSIITAVGMTDVLMVMILANVIAILIMLASASTVSGFIARHPTVKMLALAFILLIGVALVADGLGMHIPREYIYFAIAFSLAVETLEHHREIAPHAARSTRPISSSLDRNLIRREPPAWHRVIGRSCAPIGRVI